MTPNQGICFNIGVILIVFEQKVQKKALNLSLLILIRTLLINARKYKLLHIINLMSVSLVTMVEYRRIFGVVSLWINTLNPFSFFTDSLT